MKADSDQNYLHRFTHLHTAANRTHWSDYVDFWAVDWDFQSDAFVNGWTSYRTRRNRALQLSSEPHDYPAAGRYRLLVKVIDIFGNDTSQVFEVEIV